jgi:hypothetical protein
LAAQFGEHFARWARVPVRGIVKSLAYRLEDVRARGKVEQALARLDILYDGLCLAIHRDCHPSYFCNSN